MTLVGLVANAIADDRMTEVDRRQRAIAAIAAVRRWDVEHGPSEAEIEAVNRAWRSGDSRGETFRESISTALNAAAEVRAGGEQHG